nr:hypothetical protein OG781_03955 [Streptomyces sp. NBC_00830]
MTVTWRKGFKAAMTSRFVFLRVRLAGRRPQRATDGAIGLRWLIAQWPDGEDESAKYWVASLPASDSPRTVARTTAASGS